MPAREFTGGVFSDRIEGGRAGAQIELSQTGISAVTSDGQRFFVSYEKCQVEIGGFNGRVVFCRSPDRSVTIFCEDREFVRALASAAYGLLDSQIEGQLKHRRSQKWLGRRMGVALLLGIVLFVVGGYYSIRLVARAAVGALPLRVDQEIGSRAFAAMDLGGDEIKDPAVVKALQTIVDRLAPHAAIEGLEFEIHVIESPEVNAFALPGGPIVVYTGLILEVEDIEQIAGVLGHEMAHATLRHGLERIGQSAGLAMAVNFLLGDTQGIIMAGSEVFQLASINSYSREQESAADRESVRMMHEAGIDPLAITRFFIKLHEKHGDVPGVVSWISTHPQHEVRIDLVKEQVAALPAKEFRPLEIDLPHLKQLIRQR
jgi:Zn-dependent protease with chaperone function